MSEESEEAPSATAAAVSSSSPVCWYASDMLAAVESAMLCMFWRV